MGVSIHGEAYLVQKVIDQIDFYVKENGGYRENALSATEFFDKIADEFGIVLDGHFVTVYNEYYEDYNPESNFGEAVTTYYFPHVDADEYWDKAFYLEGGKTFGGGVNAGEILAHLFEDEFGYEGKFSE